MGRFVENIRQIGLFMIAAQAVIHLVPNRQYEKYVKLIAGVMILMQFVTPFFKQSEELLMKWQEEIEQIGQKIGEQGEKELIGQIQDSKGASYGLVVDSIEEELKDRFNSLPSCSGYQVSDVKIVLKEKSDSEKEVWELQKVHVVMRRLPKSTEETEKAEEVKNAGETEKEEEIGRAGENADGVEIGKVVVGEVQIGDSRIGGEEETRENTGEQEGEEKDEQDAFARIFGEELGIRETCVEVAIYGGL